MSKPSIEYSVSALGASAVENVSAEGEAMYCLLDHLAIAAETCAANGTETARLLTDARRKLLAWRHHPLHRFDGARIVERRRGR